MSSCRIRHRAASAQRSGAQDNERTRGRVWMRLREMVLVEEPVCMVCGRRPSVQVDHKQPVSKGGGDDRDNLQGICAECHEEKTMADLNIKTRRKRVGVDGYPVEK